MLSTVGTYIPLWLCHLFVVISYSFILIQLTQAAVYIYVGRKAWICPIHGLRCANHGSILCATIHGSRVSKGAKYKFADNPWIALRAQTTDSLVCSQVQSKDKLQVSGIALAS